MQRLARLLADERRRAGISQLELSLRMNVSQRHVSFVERARARPGRDLIMSWTVETGSTHSTQNAALLLGGFSLPDQRCSVVAEPPVDESTERLIEANDPLPAFAFSADWQVRAMNRGARWLCSQVMPEYISRKAMDPGEIDMIDACTASDGLLSRMIDAAAFGRAVARQLAQEAHARASLGQRLRQLEGSLIKRFGEAHCGAPSATAPCLGVAFATDHGTLRYITAQTIVALPQDVTLATPRIEFWFPTDDHTRQVQCAFGA